MEIVFETRVSPLSNHISRSVWNGVQPPHGAVIYLLASPGSGAAAPGSLRALTREPAESGAAAHE